MPYTRDDTNRITLHLQTNYVHIGMSCILASFLLGVNVDTGYIVQQRTKHNHFCILPVIIIIIIIIIIIMIFNQCCFCIYMNKVNFFLIK